MSTLDALLREWGVLIPLRGIGKIFDRSPDSLRQQITSETGFGKLLAKAVCRRGRRIYFKTVMVAELIDSEEF